MRRTLLVARYMKKEIYTGLRRDPREGYMRECALPPSSPTGAVSLPPTRSPRLIIMDLNNTLVCRKKKTARGSTAPILRPFVHALLRFCLGSETDTASEAVWAGQRTHGPYEVGIWSSSEEGNVSRMLDANLLPRGSPLRDRLIGVWGRSTLVPQRWRYDNVQVTKDLEVIWAALNLHDEARLDASERARQDMNYGRGFGDVDPSAAQHSSSMVAGPWGAQNTILLDDSVLKVKLQPFNAILPPEFGMQEVETMARMRHVLEPISGVRKTSLCPPTGDRVADAERPMRELAWDIVLRMDTTLLQVIGVLDEALHLDHDHVGHWMFSGNTQGISRWHTHLLPLPAKPAKKPKGERIALDRTKAQDDGLERAQAFDSTSEVASEIQGDTETLSGALGKLSRFDRQPSHSKNKGPSSRSTASLVSDSFARTDSSPTPGPDPLAKELYERLVCGMPVSGPRDQLYWIVRGVRACAQRGITLDIHHDVYHD